MVRWKIRGMLEKRGWTAYRLAMVTGLTVPAVYRLARHNSQMGRVEGNTLDRLCDALGVQPGDLLEHIPDKPIPRSRARGSNSQTPMRR
jgi:DNA-binding Xre family transcriptional regulator